MTENLIMGIAKDAVWTALLIAAPILGGSLLVGLLISILQATTQIQEQTLTFVPKIVAVFLILVIFGPWMLHMLLSATNNPFIDIPRLIIIH